MTANTRTPEELLEEIRRTVVAVCVVEDRYDVVVAPNELFYEEFGLPSIEVRLPIPEEYRTAEIVNNLWTDELDYPECAEAGQSYAHLVGAEALAAAIREVGDTVIAHLVGMEDYLNVARRVVVLSRPTGVFLEVYPLVLDEASGLLVTDLAAGWPTSLRVSLSSGPSQEAIEEIAAPEIFTWPSTAAPESLPDLSGVPVLALALRLMGGGE